MNEVNKLQEEIRLLTNRLTRPFYLKNEIIIFNIDRSNINFATIMYFKSVQSIEYFNSLTEEIQVNLDKYLNVDSKTSIDYYLQSVISMLEINRADYNDLTPLNENEAIRIDKIEASLYNGKGASNDDLIELCIVKTAMFLSRNYHHLLNIFNRYRDKTKEVNLIMHRLDDYIIIDMKKIIRSYDEFNGVLFHSMPYEDYIKCFNRNILDLTHPIFISKEQVNFVYFLSRNEDCKVNSAIALSQFGIKNYKQILNNMSSREPVFVNRVNAILKIS